MKRLSGLVCAIIAATLPVCAQRQLGELRIQVVDATGAPIAASGELLNQSAQYRKEFTTGASQQIGLQAIEDRPAVPGRGIIDMVVDTQF